MSIRARVVGAVALASAAAIAAGALAAVVGHIDGTCFLVDVAQQLYNCPGVDTVFDNGSIWSGGLFSLKGAAVPPDADISGTGAYAGKHITFGGKPVGATAFDWTYTITP